MSESSESWPRTDCCTGKGNTTAYDRAVWYPISNTQDLHNYTTVWTADKIQWYVDDKVVRTLNYNDSIALNGKTYPQTPMTVRLGIWAGGDPTENPNGTVEWAGGKTDYKQGPFTMVVQGLEVEDFSSGKAYKYGDTSGSWESVQITPYVNTGKQILLHSCLIRNYSGNSTIAQKLHEPHGIAGHYKALSKTARIGIAAAALAFIALCISLLTFCCIKQRRAGRRERAIADAEWERAQNELAQYKRMHVSEKEFHPRAGPRAGYF